MKLLAIDTSTEFLSLAVMKGGRIAGRFHRKSPMRHSSMLVPMIDRLLKKAGMKVGDIDCFGVSIGPGSFTGLRIAVATVKGLAYALHKKIVVVPTLDVIAANAAGFKGVICPVLDARKSKVYAAIYRSDGETIKKLSGYLLLPAEELLKKLEKYDNIIFLGEADGLIEKSRPQGQTLIRKIWHPRAEVAAIYAEGLYKKKRFIRAEDLEPLYLYSSHCDITGK